MKYKSILQFILGGAILVPIPYIFPLSTQAHNLCPTLGNKLDPTMQCQHTHFVGGKNPIRSSEPKPNHYQPGFYAYMGMNPPGIIYLWPSPWDGGKTDVWCDVPNHTMYARHISIAGGAVGVKDLNQVRNTAKYWSKPCTDDVFQQSRVQR
jgi:hypothetical protein